MRWMRGKGLLLTLLLLCPVMATGQVVTTTLLDWFQGVPLVNRLSVIRSA